MKATDIDIKVYSDNLISINNKYEKGIASYIDRNDANLRYDIAMFNKKQAIYDYIIAQIDLQKAKGASHEL
jgi:outer membrane protein TolC